MTLWTPALALSVTLTGSSLIESKPLIKAIDAAIKYNRAKHHRHKRHRTHRLLLVAGDSAAHNVPLPVTIAFS